jgi:hypothetical protein
LLSWKANPFLVIQARGENQESVEKTILYTWDYIRAKNSEDPRWSKSFHFAV